MAFPLSGQQVTVPDTYECVALKQNNLDPTVKWANTYVFTASQAGRVPTAADSIFVDIIDFELGILFKDATLVSLAIRVKVFGRQVGQIIIPLFTINVGQIGHNDQPPVGAGAPNPVGGEVVFRLRKQHADGSRQRYNFYRNTSDKNSLVAEAGGRWSLTQFGVPTPASIVTLLGTSLHNDLLIVGQTPTNYLSLPHAHKVPGVLGQPPTWIVSGLTAVTALSHAGISTNKISRKSHR